MAKVSGEYLPLSVLGEFPSDWNESTLEEVCHQVTDGTHDSPKPVAEGGYPLVTGKAIKDRRVDFSVTYNISDAEHKKVIERSKPERDDILFANIGNSIGDLVRVQTDRPFSIKNVALFKPNPSKVSARYLEYFLLSEQVQGFIKGSTRGSAQPFIGLGSLRGFPVPLPPMNEQLSIGALLGALDDRITLLRETNATLEAIAQALFKSWFVDFDPVRAKAEGRQPEGVDAATAALFPDSFEESELGLVPKGWRVRAIGELVEGIYDGPHATPAESANGPVFLGIKNLTGTSLDLSDIRHISESDWMQWTRRIEPRHGDIVFSYEATLGFFALIPPGVRCCLGRRLALVRPHSENGAGMFWFHQFISAPFQQLLDKHTIHGATVNRIALKAFPSYPVLNPPEPLKSAFVDSVAPLWAAIHENQAQAQTLTQLRDTLLPRLISGQLRLPEAETLLEKAL